METENNKPTAENDNIASRPSVWERFMTIYTCLLPIVVWVVLVCCFPVFCYPVSCDIIKSIVWLSVALYYLSVFVSVFLIPIILIGILIYDFFKLKSSVNKDIVNSRKYSRKSTLSRDCNQFHDSFIGEVIHIFLYFVMIGIIPQVDIILLNLQGIDIHSSFLVKGYACLLIYPWIVTYVILAIVIYVLIHRLVLQNRKYKRQKAKRKEALERIRKNRQDNPPLPPKKTC
jgi:heme exporter protein D